MMAACLTARAYFAGQDPALETILALIRRGRLDRLAADPEARSRQDPLAEPIRCLGVDGPDASAPPPQRQGLAQLAGRHPGQELLHGFTRVEANP